MAVAPNGSFLGGCGSTGESAAGGRRALPADRFPHQYSSQRVAATLLSYRRLRYHATPAPPLLRARLCVSCYPHGSGSLQCDSLQLAGPYVCNLTLRERFFLYHPLGEKFD